jgi:RNA polymerase sigma-70 factor (ECF subfamily)
MSVAAPVFAVSSPAERKTGATTLQRQQQLNRFLAEVERRALRYAEIAIRDADDAMDLVQEAMIKLVRNYADKPEDQWAPLFYRILQNGIRDWYRRRAVRNRVMVWFGRGNEDNDYDPIAEAPDPAARRPEDQLGTEGALKELSAALERLPPRQREAFMLRTFEGLDVAGTATAMGVSQGSVKTHYSRAVHTLRDALGDHYGE